MKVKASLNYFVCQTPLRIGLFGGGSDLPSFIKYHGFGKVINLTIDKYVYSGAKIHGAIFDKKFRFNYYETENVDNINYIKNNIIKQTLKYFDFRYPFYINTISDVPAGTGLGSSSSFLVGLCLLINSILNKKNNKKILAEQASKIIIEFMKSQAGYQDQFASSYGGINEFIFQDNLKTKVNNLNKYSNLFLNQFEKNSILIFTNKSRKAEDILGLQNITMRKKNKRNLILEMINLSEIFKKNLIMSKNCYPLFLELLNESWKIKKNLGNFVSNANINNICKFLNTKYSTSTKVLGAGGGGFILASFKDKEIKNFFLKKNKNKFKILSFKFEKLGSRLINNIY
jgi:D-glycero-alpha-D-manno-heptose-7-phosphate kinase